jgi:cytochrome c oxidase subunit 3
MPGIEQDLFARQRDLGGSRRTAFAALFVVFAATGMLFLALAAAFLGRRSLGTEWRHTELPRVIWANTGVLLASSGALELARRRLRHGSRVAFTRLWMAGAALGALFLAGQAEAWRELATAGFYVTGSASSGFIYILTAAHGAHVTAGLAALLYVTYQAWRLQLGPGKRTAADVSAWFWHYLDVLWLGLLVLLLRWA